MNDYSFLHTYMYGCIGRFSYFFRHRWHMGETVCVIFILLLLSKKGVRKERLLACSISLPFLSSTNGWCLWSDSQQSIFWKEVFVHIVPLSLPVIHTVSFYNAEQIEFHRFGDLSVVARLSMPFSLDFQWKKNVWKRCNVLMIEWRKSLMIMMIMSPFISSSDSLLFSFDTPYVPSTLEYTRNEDRLVPAIIVREQEIQMWADDVYFRKFDSN